MGLNSKSAKMGLLMTTRTLAVLCMLCLSEGKKVTKHDSRLRAVNLGGWLVTEGWIKPSLFETIPNKDFLDGTELQFKSVSTRKYLCAELGGGTVIVANRTSASGWETFRLWRINEREFNLRVFDGRFVGVGNRNGVVAEAKTPKTSETFQIVRKSDDSTLVRIRAPNGLFLQAKSEELVTADYSVHGNSAWKDNDPSIFVMKISGKMQGEFQLTNGHGPRAPQVMRGHWRTFIVEKDFEFISKNGLNGVRIPVGWWIASDPNPPKPFVGGSLKVLDNAFSWAQKYGLRIIVDLHAAPGSQNGWEHSGARDSSIEWAKTDDNINQTVRVIEFLTARYAKSPSLYAVELVNEPRAPFVSLEEVSKYYKAGYEAVRRHSRTAHVVLSNRLGNIDTRELFHMAGALRGSVIDVHYYNLFTSEFTNMTPQQHLNYVLTNRTAQLTHISTSNGPPILVGEWVAEWPLSGASKEDYQRFAKAQLKLFGKASFGWAYWTLKNINNHWSLEWMINNGYIKPLDFL